MNFLAIIAIIVGAASIALAMMKLQVIQRLPAGTKEMTRIAGLNRAGAFAFLRREYIVIAALMVVVFFAIGFGIGSWSTAVCFLFYWDECGNAGKCAHDKCGSYERHQRSTASCLF